jgi:hypothetical protein
MALSTSAAMALESATRSWLARESRRTRVRTHRGQHHQGKISSTWNIT